MFQCTLIYLRPFRCIFMAFSRWLMSKRYREDRERLERIFSRHQSCGNVPNRRGRGRCLDVYSTLLADCATAVAWSLGHARPAFPVRRCLANSGYSRNRRVQTKHYCYRCTLRPPWLSIMFMVYEHNTHYVITRHRAPSENYRNGRTRRSGCSVTARQIILLKWLWRYCLLFSPRRRRSMFYRRWFVCLSVCVCRSVTTITEKIVNGFVPNFMGRFLGGKERPSSCFVTIGRGMWK